MDKSESIRSMSVIAHVDHGKTTLADSLLSRAGIIATKSAGDAKFMQGRKDEQERGVTIKSTGVTLFFEHDCEDGAGPQPHLINLIDSPGHVDFSSEVTAALRITDGAIVVVDCIEGCAVQTETVLRQALQERVKPCLFVNKVDRCILEMQMDVEEIYCRFRSAIENVNVIIATYSDPSMGSLQMDPAIGNVAFGSGLHGWGFSIERFAKIYAQKMGVNKAKMMEHLWGDWYYYPKRKVWTTASQPEDLKEPLQRAFCQYIMGPINQLIRAIMDQDTDKYEKMMESLGIVLKGEDRELKGKPLMKHVMQTWINAADSLLAMIVTQLPSPKVAQRYRVETLYEGPMDLVVCSVDESGEHVIAGCGELHVEICLKDLREEFAQCDFTVSDPVVSYRETVSAPSKHVCLAKSPNRLNRLYVAAEPLAEEVVRAVEDGTAGPYADAKEKTKILTQFGWDKQVAQSKIWCYGPSGDGPNVFVDTTIAAQYLGEVKDHVVNAFQWVTKEGPLCEESLRGVRFNLSEVLLHSDKVHRGAGQIMPATRRCCFASELTGSPTLQEPVKAYLPVSESFGFVAALRQATSGQAFPQCVFDHWESLPGNCLEKGSKMEELVLGIRKRKSLKVEMPSLTDYLDKLGAQWSAFHNEQYLATSRAFAGLADRPRDPGTTPAGAGALVEKEAEQALDISQIDPRILQVEEFVDKLRKKVLMWEVVGGAREGGVVVREGASLQSPELRQRLATGSIVREIAEKGDRLCYQLLSGFGPPAGWVSIK
ncbi:unnamed protein product, partial [Symbiodinium microadriaticum]